MKVPLRTLAKTNAVFFCLFFFKPSESGRVQNGQIWRKLCVLQPSKLFWTMRLIEEKVRLYSPDSESPIAIFILIKGHNLCQTEPDPCLCWVKVLAFVAVSCPVLISHFLIELAWSWVNDIGPSWSSCIWPSTSGWWLIFDLTRAYRSNKIKTWPHKVALIAGEEIGGKTLVFPAALFTSTL